MTIVIFGGEGMVGSRFITLHSGSFEIIAPTIAELDFTDFEKTKNFLESKNPSVVINFAAITNVEASEEEKGNREGLTYKVNSLAVKNLAQVCKEQDYHLIHISTDYVFDGTRTSPYTEEDNPNPINWYGETKYLGEKFIKDVDVGHTIVRIEMPFSAHFELKKDIARIFLNMLQNSQKIKAITDSDITPVLVDDIANALKLLIEKKPTGIYHVVSTSTTTPFKFAKKIAETFGLDENLVKETTFNEYNRNKKAKLLRHSWLDSSKFVKEFGEGILHTIDESLELFKKQVQTTRG